ncbi:MAG: MFS transporter, partial [Chloroflexota bacterium]|nr:MFS transporter [Chloroflexota bacterium]
VLILSTYITSALGMSYLQLLPSFSNIFKNTINGDISAQILGLMASAGGIGALTGTLVTSRLNEKINLGKRVLASNVVSVFFLFLFGLSNMFIFEDNIYQNPWISYNLIISSFLIIFTGLSNSIFMVGSMSLLQMKVPDNLRGRVMGIHTITFSLMSAGALFLGLIAELLSSSISVMLAAALLIIINSFIYLRNSEIRDINN